MFSCFFGALQYFPFGSILEGSFFKKGAYLEFGADEGAYSRGGLIELLQYCIVRILAEFIYVKLVYFKNTHKVSSTTANGFVCSALNNSSSLSFLANLPPPVTLEQLGARILAQERFERMQVSGISVIKYSSPFFFISWRKTF